MTFSIWEFGVCYGDSKQAVDLIIKLSVGQLIFVQIELICVNVSIAL